MTGKPATVPSQELPDRVPFTHAQCASSRDDKLGKSSHVADTSVQTGGPGVAHRGSSIRVRLEKGN